MLPTDIKKNVTYNRNPYKSVHKISHSDKCTPAEGGAETFDIRGITAGKVLSKWSVMDTVTGHRPLM